MTKIQTTVLTLIVPNWLMIVGPDSSSSRTSCGSNGSSSSSSSRSSSR